MVTSVDRRSGTRVAQDEKWRKNDLALAALPLLQNTLSHLNALGLGERVTSQYIIENASIAPSATTTVLSVAPGPGYLGVWQFLTQVPQTSNELAVQFFRDGVLMDNDLSAIERTVVLPTVAGAVHFNTLFQVTVTNLSASQTILYTVRGLLYQIEHLFAIDLKNALENGVQAAIQAALDEPW